MKLALVTTTTSVPHVLSLFRELNASVAFFVAGDRRTPRAEVGGLSADLGNATDSSDTDQERLGYRSSEPIGWNCIQRWSIALLEAWCEDVADVLP